MVVAVCVRALGRVTAAVDASTRETIGVTTLEIPRNDIMVIECVDEQRCKTEILSFLVACSNE